MTLNDEMKNGVAGDVKMHDESELPTIREPEADTHFEQVPPPYYGGEASTTPSYTAPTPAEYAATSTPPPAALSPANYVRTSKYGGSIDAAVLLDLAVPYVARPRGNWFTEMARGRAERQEERRAWRDERRGFKEERRDAILGLVGLGGKKEEPKEGEEEVPVMKTGVGVRDVHPNLFLEGHNFGVSGEVWVLDSGERKERGRAVLKLVNYHAKVDLVVHTLSLNAGRARPHLSITMHSQNGSVNMALPREFRGQLRLSSDHGRIRLSPAVEAITEKQSKTYRTLTCFVGQMPENWHTLSVQVGTAGEGSVGVDEAVAVTRNGSVTVRFEDEPPLEGLISEVAGALKRVVTGKNGKPADADMEENQLVTQSEVAGLERGEKEMEVESMV